jgi:ribosomal protein S18 acetylase RimI-like enzyme
VTVRRASLADLPVLEELWRAFEREVPPPAHVDVDPDVELGEIREIVDAHLAFVADDAGTIVGLALARRKGQRHGFISDLYVVPERRRAGVAAALVHAVAETFAADGVEVIDLEVMASNAEARAVYERWGFRDEVLTLAAPVRELLARVAAGEAAPSFGSVHVQTDDVDAIVRAVEIYVPRLPGGSRGSIVTQPRGGYVTVYDDVCDRDPAMLRRLAREISSRTGLVAICLGIEEESCVRLVLFDRGSVVDEYASVPEHHGPLPPGEVVALAANPVVIERYTGADQNAVRAATPTAAAAAELPPPRELLAGLAGALGLADALHGWGDAPNLPGAVRVAR